VIPAFAVFLKRDLGELPLGGHLVYLEAQDFPGFWLDSECNAHGLALGVDARLEVIKLDLKERFFRKALQELFLGAPGLGGEEQESPADGFGIDLQDPRGPGL
jgi:hypothetical protein